MMANLKSEINQTSPFSTLEEEVLLNLVRTADCLQRAFQHETRNFGLSSTQYNVLRILRGAPTDGLPCAVVGARMVAAEPDITRLLGRLKALKLIRQHRDPQDRRVVLSQITDSGLKLLHEMDPLIRRLPSSLLGHLSTAELNELIRLLELARQSGDAQASA